MSATMRQCHLHATYIPLTYPLHASYVGLCKEESLVSNPQKRRAPKRAPPLECLGVCFADQRCHPSFILQPPTAWCGKHTTKATWPSATNPESNWASATTSATWVTRGPRLPYMHGRAFPKPVGKHVLYMSLPHPFLEHAEYLQNILLTCRPM